MGKGWKGFRETRQGIDLFSSNQCFRCNLGDVEKQWESNLQQQN
jgi:hypothetical protein